jgi:DNA-binding LacI/PurR family transcriptional regulator
MRVTIKDVSRIAGVSIKTVSRVLNKEKYVREETRAKVTAAVAELNFSPSLAARTLAGSRSFQIALITTITAPITSMPFKLACGRGAANKACGCWPNPLILRQKHWRRKLAA